MLHRLRNYTQLRPEDHVSLASLKQQSFGIRAMARMLNRPASSISRELQRNSTAGQYTSAAGVNSSRMGAPLARRFTSGRDAQPPGSGFNAPDHSRLRKPLGLENLQPRVDGLRRTAHQQPPEVCGSLSSACAAVGNPSTISTSAPYPAQFRLEAPVTNPSATIASTPSSSGTFDHGRQPCPTRQFERVAGQAKTGHICQRMHAFKLRQRNAGRVELRCRGDQLSIPGF